MFFTPFVFREINRIHISCHISSSHGPLFSDLSMSVKRWVRQDDVRTVVRAAGHYKWEVSFDLDGKSKICNSGSLKLVHMGSDIPLDKAYATVTTPLAATYRSSVIPVPATEAVTVTATTVSFFF